MGSNGLSGRRVLAIVSNYGVEQDELLMPVKHLRDQGAQVDVAATSGDPVETLVGDKNPGETVQPSLTLETADASAYDLLLIPGGTLNADRLRQETAAVGLIGAFKAAGRPVAAICHGPWTLVEAGVTAGKTMTSYSSLRTDIRNSGGHWVDEAVVSDESGGWTLITSRTPRDLNDFVGAIDKALAA